MSAELKARTPALHTQGAGYSLCKGPGRHLVQLEAPTNHISQNLADMPSHSTQPICPFSAPQVASHLQGSGCSKPGVPCFLDFAQSTRAS